MSEKLQNRILGRTQTFNHNALTDISAQAPLPKQAEYKRVLEGEAFTLAPTHNDHETFADIASRTKKLKIAAPQADVADSDKLASTNCATADDDSGNDSDIEFLFTLPCEMQNESLEDRKQPAEVEHSKNDKKATNNAHPTKLKDKLQNAANEPPLLYTYASSAYVQNLAEMCYTIMHDIRWRTMENHTLFRWELGDDLSVVKELCRYYQQESKIGCALCRNIEREGHETTFEANSAPRMQQTEMNHNLDEARAIHLYCRLFYRKGPWHRFDDIYKKYYAPKVKRADSEVDELSYVEAKENTIRGNSQHQQRKMTNCSKVTGPLTDSFSATHSNVYEQHKEGIGLLIADLCWLFSAGFIRSFESEEECGKTVGCSLLRSNERTLVLSKLGAKTKTKPTRSSDNSAINEIWKQMQNQKSFWSHYQPKNDKKSSFLPVRKHVDEIIFQQVAKCVVQAYGADEHMRNAMTRSLLDYVTNHVRDSLRRSTKASKFTQLPCITCIRLREPPLKTLKRLTRLYLCATGGPGQMRGDGCNGWRSIETKDSLHNLPLSPPIDANWHQISYPGLMVRFGCASALFSKAFHLLHVEQVCSDHKNTDQISSLIIFDSYESFRAWEAAAELRGNVDYLIELNEMIRYNKRKMKRGDRVSFPLPLLTDANVDFFGVSEKRIRKNFIVRFLRANRIGDQCTEGVLSRIESDLDDSLPMVKLCCERVLHTIGIICLHLLRIRHESIGTSELKRISGRPWLRHLAWDGCVAYLLWDIFPYFERNNFYRLALLSLQVLVSGRVDDRVGLDFPQNPSPLALHLISRRARGKAFDRIIIDFTHFTRTMKKEVDNKMHQKETMQLMSERILSFTNTVIREASSSCSISFGSIRTLAKRLRCPLSETLADSTPIEARELGLRLDNDCINPCTKRGYRDWSPLTDRSVANALKSEQSNGGRCSFVGHEDQAVLCSSSSSLNVEELAIECYKSGRLPAPSDDTSLSGGGYHGWHDEGGHVRALFRILCSRSVLGMDWGESSLLVSSKAFRDHHTVHLSPYQGAPFDLHVGHGTQTYNTSFYSRRREQIAPFLSWLQKLNSQEIADLVYDEVSIRVHWSMQNGTNDPHLVRDILQLRTLSALAAGFGGLQLAAVFRCLFFDYRYYSGGLPDLLLFRAVYEDSLEMRNLEFVELGEWIGEEFSQEYQAAICDKLGASILSDRDDEFLGCSKAGDSGGQGAHPNLQRRGKMQNINSTDPHMTPSKDILPERLLLSHNNRKVKIDCIMVEVKSANDRLDPRQEDWLNILDQHGNARVCKFEKSSKATRPEESVNSKYEE